MTKIVAEGKLVSTTVTLSTGKEVTVSHKAGIVVNRKAVSPAFVQGLDAGDRRKLRKALTEIGRADLAKESLAKA